MPHLGPIADERMIPRWAHGDVPQVVMSLGVADAGLAFRPRAPLAPLASSLHGDRHD